MPRMRRSAIIVDGREIGLKDWEISRTHNLVCHGHGLLFQSHVLPCLVDGTTRRVETVVMSMDIDVGLLVFVVRRSMS